MTFVIFGKQPNIYLQLTRTAYTHFSAPLYLHFYLTINMNDRICCQTILFTYFQQDYHLK